MGNTAWPIFFGKVSARKICSSFSHPAPSALAFGRAGYYFAEPIAKQSIKNIFDVVGALPQKCVKLLPHQGPFIHIGITRHRQISCYHRSPFSSCSMSQRIRRVVASPKTENIEGASGYCEDHNAVIGKKHGVHRGPPLLRPAQLIGQSAGALPRLFAPLTQIVPFDTSG
jgi:hypothetical protein